VDLLYFLNQRLGFAGYFYAHTAALFQEIKRKIEAEEPPYVDTRDPEYADGPVFFKEWEQADAGMAVSGSTSLDLVQSALHTYLHEYVCEIGHLKALEELTSEMKQELKKRGLQGWFHCYRVFFSKALNIDWMASGADLGCIEQVILARNDFTHNISFQSLDARQTKDHVAKYPDSPFAAPHWKTLFPEHPRLIVPADALEKAIAAVRTLAEYLEKQRYAR
jgi:hypothetical protein